VRVSPVQAISLACIHSRLIALLYLSIHKHPLDLPFVLFAWTRKCLLNGDLDGVGVPRTSPADSPSLQPLEYASPTIYSPCSPLATTNTPSALHSETGSRNENIPLQRLRLQHLHPPLFPSDLLLWLRLFCWSLGGRLRGVTHVLADGMCANCASAGEKEPNNSN